MKLYLAALRHPQALVKRSMVDLPISPSEWNTLCHNFAWLAVIVGRGNKRIDFIEDDPEYVGGWLDIRST